MTLQTETAGVFFRDGKSFSDYLDEFPDRV